MVNLHTTDLNNFALLVNYAQTNEGVIKLQINAGIWKISYSEAWGDPEDSFTVTGNSLCEILADAAQNLPKSDDALALLRRKLGGTITMEPKMDQNIDPATLEAQISLYLSTPQAPEVVNSNLGTEMHQAMENYVEDITKNEYPKDNAHDPRD